MDPAEPVTVATAERGDDPSILGFNGKICSFWTLMFSYIITFFSYLVASAMMSTVDPLLFMCDVVQMLQATTLTAVKNDFVQFLQVAVTGNLKVIQYALKWNWWKTKQKPSMNQQYASWLMLLFIWKNQHRTVVFTFCWNLRRYLLLVISASLLPVSPLLFRKSRRDTDHAGDCLTWTGVKPEKQTFSFFVLS